MFLLIGFLDIRTSLLPLSVRFRSIGRQTPNTDLGLSKRRFDNINHGKIIRKYLNLC